MDTSASPNAEDLRFGAEDVALLEQAVAISPELRIAVALVKRTRRAGLAYPVETVDPLVAVLDDRETISYLHHRIDEASVRRYMAPEWFPIKDETRLLQRMHLALMVCLQDTLGFGPAAAAEVELGWVALDEQGNEIERGG